MEPGEIFGLLGPNGAGKTTTINMLIGLSRLSGGEAYVDGFSARQQITEIKGRIGVVADESNLYDELSGRDNLLFCGTLYGLLPQERSERARRLLEQFGLEVAQDKRFRAYSRGMKRKLTIAAALMHQPPLLFLDEPTTGIDVESARQIRRMLQELNASGVTIFLTTHYIEEAERLCHRVALMVEGSIVATGSPAQLIESCQTNHVVQLTLDQPAAPFIGELATTFPEVEVNRVSEQAVAVTSAEGLDIAPFAAWFHQRTVGLLEARLMRPTLETAFVQLTRLDAQSLKKEKEGKPR